MICKELTYRNIMSVGNTPITIKLDKAPTTVIGGVNGAGKSTMLEALTYVLTGKTLKKTKLASVINRHNNKQLEVTLNFEANGFEYTVIRGMKPDVFQIYRGEDQLDMDANKKDLQAKLEFITGVDHDSLTQMVVLNLERFKPFMDMASPDRRKLVEEILNIQIFGEMNKLQKAEIKKLETQKANSATAIRIIQSKKETLEKVIADASQSNEGALAEQMLKVEESSAAIDELEKQLTEAKALINEEEESENKLGATHVTQHKSELNNELSSTRTTIRQLKSEMDFMSKGECPTCNQELPNHEDSVSCLHTKLEELHAKEKEQILAIGDATSMQTMIAGMVDADAHKRSDVSKLELAVRQENRLLELHIDNYAKLSAKAGDDTSDMESQVSELDAQIAEESIKYDGICNEIVINEQALEVLSDKGVKLNIIKDYIQFINYRVNDFLNGMEFYVNITLDESFNETFSSPSKIGSSYADMSTGEKRRVNLAIWLALIEVSMMKNSVVSNVLFLDEILENMDDLGVSLFVKLIKEKMPNKNVFVITQRFQDFRDKFTSEIIFAKDDDFTILA